MSRLCGIRRRFVPVALAILGAGGSASAQLQVGSFVSGERRMYLEMSPLVEGQKFDLDLSFEVAGPRKVKVVVRNP